MSRQGKLEFRGGKNWIQTRRWGNELEKNRGKRGKELGLVLLGFSMV